MWAFIVWMHYDSFCRTKLNASAPARASIAILVQSSLEFARGTLGTVRVSFGSQYRTPMEIVGDKGVLFADNALTVERPIRLELRRGETIEIETLSNHLAYARQVDAFAAALEDGREFPAPGEEG